MDANICVRMQKKAVSICNLIGSHSQDQVQRVEGDNTKSLMDEARGRLCIKFANQPTLFKDGATLIEAVSYTHLTLPTKRIV